MLISCNIVLVLLADKLKKPLTIFLAKLEFSSQHALQLSSDRLMKAHLSSDGMRKAKSIPKGENHA